MVWGAVRRPATGRMTGWCQSASFTVPGSSAAEVEFDDLQITGVPQGVPEPASLLLVGSGVAVLAGAVKRRRRNGNRAAVAGTLS
jgi:hypothetical protein